MTAAAAHAQRLDTLCDRCTAPAKFQVLIPSAGKAGRAGELLFCRHHWSQHGSPLAQEFVIVPMEGGVE